MASLLPPSATALERALDDVGQRAEEIPAGIVAIMKDPERAPARLLAWLAWERSADDWPADAAERRRVVAAAPMVHRVKGTLAAVKAALAARGYDASVVEWFEAEPEGRPYTFAIDIEVRDRSWAEADYDAALATAMRTKNLRSHLDRLTARQTVDAAAFVAAATIPHETVTVFPPAPGDIETATAPAARAATLAGEHTRIEIDLTGGISRV